MAQKTNLNVSPYFDDFDAEKNFYKVLFTPGRPVQSRELNTLQSLLQNQIESFGKHIFKDGSVVIPGNVTYDSDFYAVKLNPSNFGISIIAYVNQFIGKRVTGQISGIVAEVQKIEIPDNVNKLDYITLYVKYTTSSSDFKISQFQDGESLTCDENIVYGNTTIASGTPFASLISSDATAIGSSASIDEGIYFIRGTFAKVSKQTIILDPYTNRPSYRIGLSVSEEIITPKDDSSLYDNAKGFSNYAAPGADRFKIGLTLTKKTLDSIESTLDFIELLRVENGEIKKLNVKTNYSLIRDYLAQRTFDESGNYSVTPFKISLHNSLNDKIGNDGLFFDNQKTEEGKTPSDNLMCVKLSPGKAYVRGYDIEKTSTTIVDVEKPRQTQSIKNVSIPFEMGNLIRVNNVSGAPKKNETIQLHSVRRSSSGNPSAGTRIGDARVYNYQLTDSAHKDQTTNWDLYLYDIQTYTKLTLNVSASSLGISTSYFIQGKSSNASGYSIDGGSGSEITLRQTSGTFIKNEQILINNIDSKSGIISSIVTYDANDIKQVYQSNSVSGFTTSFLADSLLTKIIPSGFNAIDAKLSINSSNDATSPGKFFNAIKPGSIIRYQKPGSADENYNVVVSVNSTGSSMTLAPVNSVSGVCNGTVGVATDVNFSVGIPQIIGYDKGFLYAELPNQNVASVDLNGSTLTFTAQSTTATSTSSGSITLSVSNFSLPSGLSTALFLPFDEERYSVHYSDGTTENLTPDKFELFNNTITLNNLTPGKTTSCINATLIKNGVQSKKKQFNRSKIINVTHSRYLQSGTNSSQSISDGLAYNQYYGLRVQDENISLNYPDVVKVLAVYESLDSANPTTDSLNFDVLVNVGGNAIVGENILGLDSNTVARVVSKTSNSVGIIYLNQNKFIIGEVVNFEESNINAVLNSITLGNYNDITNKFTLDKGQRDQYYDYSRIVRNRGESEPSRRLLIVFDYYSIPENDNGDVFTVLSYDGERFSQDIPSLGVKKVRSSDTLDFRPMVASPFTSSNSSPFDFSSRNFSNQIKLNLAPDENSIIGYDYYLGRIDKIFLDKNGNFVYNSGVSADSPSSQLKMDDLMELATITLPPYLYNISDAFISLVDNKRYTMRDIGKIETRVKNLETITSLSLLELNTQTFQIQDAQGLNRFKTGFFVDDFKDKSRLNTNLSLCEVNSSAKELTPIISRNSLKNYLIPSANLTNEVIDLSANYELLDPNVQKTGDCITLKYVSVEWLTQPIATRLENINPYHVTVVRGIVTLSPSSDSWVRTIELPDRTISITNYLTTDTLKVKKVNKEKRIQGSGEDRTKIKVKEKTKILSESSETETSSERSLISSQNEEYMRSRNTQFSITNLKSFVQYYQFIDGNSSVDFIPKLLEISSNTTLTTPGSSGIFEVGETVIGYDPVTNEELISFRVATSNHKLGPYNSPTDRYSLNPYSRTENIPDQYSQSSSLLNVDIFSLSDESQGLYSGYVVQGTKLVGQTSKAIAYVSNRRLISDANGMLIGSFFLRNPNTDPAPLVRINTGTKTFKVSSSSTNVEPLPGDSTISSAETTYTSEGTLELYENVIINTTTVTTVRRTKKKIVKTKVDYYDPLAQSFIVGGSGTVNNDENGVFITSADVYFATKSSSNATVTAEIRTMELGTPTLIRVGDEVTLTPDQVNISDDGSIATKFTFPYPIYLEPNAEYALVLLAPETTEYQVYIAQMNEATVETRNLPAGAQQTYNQQWGNGSLFKSQNGSIWTPDQNQDLKFKLYRAEFSTNSGTAYFSNPTLDKSNNYVKNLINNPITTLPRKLTIGINTTTNAELVDILTSGRKVGESVKDYVYGYVVGTGCSVSSVGITTGGINYAPGSNVQTYNIVGSGSGLTLNITSVSTGTSSITGVSIVNSGNGYAVGDVVGLVTSTVSSSSGAEARITILGNNNGIDTLYLSNVQGQQFTSDGSASLVYYNNSGTRVSVAGTNIRSSTEVGSIYSGNYFNVDHFNHGMYALNNKVKINGVTSNLVPTTLTQDLISSSTSISIANTSIFSTFEGIPVGTANTGYVLIGNEIIGYEQVNSGPGSSGTLTVLSRGQESTIILNHSTGDIVYKYELNGISLRRINKTHDISDVALGLDNYYIDISRSSNGTDRSLDSSGKPQLSFTGELSSGGSKVYATENILFDSLVPYYNTILPDKSLTSVSSAVRTVSGTSIGGNEISFLDQGYENVQINSLNKLQSVRLICSKENEDEYLDGMPRNKSFITTLQLSSTDKYLSPQVFLDDSFTDYRVSRINSPISNYAEDGRVNSIEDDPHIAFYISNTVRLANPSTSLKVILSAYRHVDADFRVLYSLIRADSSEIEQSFELFPGYDNLTIDNNNDGFLDIINPSKNSGLPDVFVPPSLDNQFLDYEFSVNNIGPFVGYSIKIVMSSTNQAQAPRFKDIRTIALA